MAQTNEPSVEEILESIKKVIARDNHTATGNLHFASRKVKEEIEQNLDDHSGILHLSESTAVPEAETSPSRPPLVTDHATSAMRESLAALSVLSTPSASPQIVRSGETSLEELTRELLRPMLAEWLDHHLPAMVQQLVAQEISRIVGKRG